MSHVIAELANISLSIGIVHCLFRTVSTILHILAYVYVSIGEPLCPFSIFHRESELSLVGISFRVG